MMDGLIVGLFFTFVIGSTVSRIQIEILESTHKLSLKTGSVFFGRVLRAGEKGILFFDQSAKHVLFLQSNDIGTFERIKAFRYPSLLCLLLPSGSKCSE